MNNERIEVLRKQLADIDKIMDDCKDKKGMERLVEHLKGRRDMTVNELKKMGAQI